MKIIKILIPLLIAVGLSGCLKDNESEYETQARIANEAIQAYLTENAIDAEKASSGVYFEVLKANENGTKVAENHVVSVVYRMRLLTGAILEIHADTLNPVRFSHSRDALIPVGLNYEVNRMRVGEVYRFYVPAYLAFINYAHEALFPKYSNFILDVEVVDVQTEDQRFAKELELIENYLDDHELSATQTGTGLYFIRTSDEGTGNLPVNLSTIKAHYTLKYLNGAIVESSIGKDPLTFQFGVSGSLIPGFEQGLKLMKQGEKALLIMPSKLAYGKSVQVIPQLVRRDWETEKEINPGIPPYMPLLFEVEMVEVK